MPAPAEGLERGVRLGVDVGSVRVGVAASDPGGLLATPVETVPRTARDPGRTGRRRRRPDRRARRSGTVRSGSSSACPGRSPGRRGPPRRRARTYASVLAARIAPVPVRLVDERLTTVEAHRALRESGVAGRRQRAVVDQAAAVLILQAALDTERTTGTPAGERVGGRTAQATDEGHEDVSQDFTETIFGDEKPPPASPKSRRELHGRRRSAAPAAASSPCSSPSPSSAAPGTPPGRSSAPGHGLFGGLGEHRRRLRRPRRGRGRGRHQAGRHRRGHRDDPARRRGHQDAHRLPRRRRGRPRSPPPRSSRAPTSCVKGMRGEDAFAILIDPANRRGPAGDHPRGPVEERDLRGPLEGHRASRSPSTRGRQGHRGHRAAGGRQGQRRGLALPGELRVRRQDLGHRAAEADGRAHRRGRSRTRVSPRRTGSAPSSSPRSSRAR